MFLNRQDLESGYGEAFPSMGMLDSYSLVDYAHQPTRPTEQEAESPFSRPDGPLAGSSGPAADATTHMNVDLAVCRPTDIPGYQLGNSDLSDWHHGYMACLQYFVDQGQHSPSVQSAAAFLNIRLPCQRLSNPISRLPGSLTAEELQALPSASSVSLRPYIRRLIVTGYDMPSVLQLFFGDAWQAGTEPIIRQERVNYLFTAKSSGWASTKAAYDILPDEQTPFLRALHDPKEDEIREAEGRWSEWLAMEDWMVGPRSPF